MKKLSAASVALLVKAHKGFCEDPVEPVFAATRASMRGLVHGGYVELQPSYLVGGGRAYQVQLTDKGESTAAKSCEVCKKGGHDAV